MVGVLFGVCSGGGTEEGSLKSTLLLKMENCVLWEANGKSGERERMLI